MKRFGQSTIAWALIISGIALGQDSRPGKVSLQVGELSVLFRDNSQSPAILSGLDSLHHLQQSPNFDAFDPDTQGASAGLNFEHIISGHRSRHNKFTPRHGTYVLHADPDGRSVTLVRKAADSPWLIDSTLKYTLVAPHYVDFEFQCTPRDATKFGKHGYALFFFANYMNDVANVALHFLGRQAKGEPQQWISADAPKGPVNWNGGGNYMAEQATQLAMDDDVEFRLNTWTYEWPRISKPFYYGRADKGMTLILMFDRLFSQRDQIRFSLYKFKLPRHPRPAWDFQYVVNQVKSNENYGFRGRLVWKKFESREDCLAEYEKWSKSLLTTDVRRLRDVGATVFERDGRVIEVNANRTSITNEQLGHVARFANMTDLSVEGTAISDAGVERLSNLTKLEWLNLYRCQVGDGTLRMIKHLPALKHLPIGGSRVSDEGLKHLADKTQLLYLGLRNTRVTDKGLAYLQDLISLNGLHLGETLVTDEGLSFLSNMKKLRKLWLDKTNITDDGIHHLAKLSSLTELHIRETKLTNEGIRRLRGSLPRCHIESE